MAVLRILNRSGDTAVTWKPDAYAAGDTDAVAAVREAETLLAVARASGGTAFVTAPGKAAVRVDGPVDWTSEQTVVVVPRIAGG